MKKVLKTIAMLIIVAGIGYLVFLTSKTYHSGKCEGMDINVLTGDTDSLITEAQVRQMVESNFDSLQNRSLQNISLLKIEQTLRNSPYVKDVDVYVTMNRKLKLKIRSFIPVLRIISNGHKSFYLDHRGYIIPVNPYHPSHVLLASGNLEISVSDTALSQNLHYKQLNDFSGIEELFNLAKQIKENRFLKAQVEQIYRNRENEYELIPKIGDQVIIFGSASLIKNKLKKLEALYRQAIPARGWETYEVINLKYENQVICSK
ncbi:MAG: hypothetical protein K9J27_06350 [Bacteroidales bacterium]|nr:hypothetical protein [Bacteroidales bacterium]MCF8333295.1 hypothetical protein [Bacteroidales bacterium]